MYALREVFEHTLGLVDRLQLDECLGSVEQCPHVAHRIACGHRLLGSLQRTIAAHRLGVAIHLRYEVVDYLYISLQLCDAAPVLVAKEYVHISEGVRIEPFVGIEAYEHTLLIAVAQVEVAHGNACIKVRLQHLIEFGGYFVGHSCFLGYPRAA